MTSTACDDQWAMDRDAAVDELARTVCPTEWRGGGNMRHAGHTITWGEYCMRRHELEEEEEGATKRHDLLTKLAMEHAPDEWGDAATWTYDERQFGWNEYQLRRTELINRPSWDDAPEWAQWLAQDVSGRWMWYGDEPSPVYDAEEWQPESGKFFTASSGAVPAGHDWRETLEKRPAFDESVKWTTKACTQCADAIGQNGATGEHYSEAPCGSDASACDLNPCGACYAEDSDSESALSQALREAKQPRYQDHNGDDWIDEFARTATPEEFRGAMRFTVGKYLRRLGRKDAELSEVRKMRDYCQRWEAYLMELES